MLRSAIILRVTRISSSLSSRTYAAQLEGRPFLIWWVERFTLIYPEHKLHILCNSEDDEVRIKKMLPHEIDVLRSDVGTGVREYAWAASLLGAPTTVFLSYGFLFAAKGLLGKIIDHHQANGNDWTQIVGLPLGVAPEIFQTGCLSELDGLDIPGLSRENGPANMLAQMLFVVQRSGIEAPLQMRSSSFDYSKIYCQQLAELPNSVFMDGCEGLEIARRVVADAHFDSSNKDNLKLWRLHSVSERMNFRKDLFAELPSIQVPRKHSGPKRVLFISLPSGFSGAEQSLCQLTSCIDRTRFVPLALLGGDGIFASKLRERGVEVTIADRNFGADDGNTFLYLVSMMRKLDPDLIHFNAMSGLPTMYAALLMKVPIITHLRNSDVNEYRELVRASTGIIAISRLVREEALKLEASSEIVEVIYNEVDTNDYSAAIFDKHQCRAQLSLPQDAKICLMIARFVPYKRHDLLLAAISRVKLRMPQVYVVLVGEFYHESMVYDEVLRVVDEQNMGGWIKIVAFTDDIRPYEAAADVLILPSEREALGRCVVEAMSIGLPVIVNDSGGSREIIEHGKTGFVFESGNALQLAVLIESVLTDSGLSSQVSRDARLFAQEHLDSRISAAKVMDFYDWSFEQVGVK